MLSPEEFGEIISFIIRFSIGVVIGLMILCVLFGYLMGVSS